MTATVKPVFDPYVVTEKIGGAANVAKFKAIQRDFRTDTITIPSDEMLLATLLASRGDDVYHEDSSTAALEARVAKLAGKEAGIFLVSGTMSNQLALRTHLHQPPHSVFSDYRAHVYINEAGGIAFHSQASSTPILPKNGHHLTLEDDVIPNVVLGDNIHSAPTRVISLENTLNGMIFPQDEVVKISKWAKEHDIAMHLDGARLWNAAAAVEGTTIETLGETLKTLCDPFETVSLCMSKGLGAPIGSVLVGPKKFIKKVEWFRKLFGGGIRQSGGLAASADFALTYNFDKLVYSHQMAKKLAEGLEELGMNFLVKQETSMIFIDPTPLGFTLPELIKALASLSDPITIMMSRIVCHLQITEQAVVDFIACVKTLKEKAIAEGFVPSTEKTEHSAAIKLY